MKNNNAHFECKYQTTVLFCFIWHTHFLFRNLSFGCLNFWDEAWWFLLFTVFCRLSPSFFIIFKTLWSIHPLAFFRPKHCEYNTKDEDNFLKTLNDKNYPLVHSSFILSFFLSFFLSFYYFFFFLWLLTSFCFFGTSFFLSFLITASYNALHDSVQ